MTSTIVKEAVTFKALSRLIWGTSVKYELFDRWTQGIEFGEDETTALIQHEGGPCAVLAPLQAFVLKNILFSQEHSEHWRELKDEARNNVLCDAVLDILTQAKSSSSFVLVSYSKPSTNDVQSNADEATSSSAPDAESDGESKAKKGRFGPEEFHANLHLQSFSEDVARVSVQKCLGEWRQRYGLLLFLYSVVLTKGLEQLRNEVEDPDEPLIDRNFGHGSQSLINLFIAGKATSNVFDNEKEVSGMILRGITQQATVGFLTLLEYLRYCEVGWFLKNPRYPVWVLGSETHLTVLFSEDAALVTHEPADAAARREFRQIDEEGSGFISTERLGELMGRLDLVSEPEYVKIMAEKMDPEQLGVITLVSFLDEFYPAPSDAHNTRSFQLLHYNGQSRNCATGVLRYARGRAHILDMPELQIITDQSQIKLCLETKWPTVELEWEGRAAPSLN